MLCLLDDKLMSHLQHRLMLSAVDNVKHGLLGVFLCLTMTACGGGPPAKLYLLEPLVDEQQTRTPTESKNIGLAVVKVPGYADDKPIASRLGGTRVLLTEDHQWAESPDTAITRVLANRMRAYSGGNVIVEPWPRGFDPESRVEFDFDKLLRDERGGAEVSGQLRIISGDGREVLAVRSFQVMHESGGVHQEDFFIALARAINDIARLATFTMLSVENPS